MEWDIQLLIHKKELIDGVFMPISRDDIGTGSFATVFKGTMKFQFEKKNESNLIF